MIKKNILILSLFLFASMAFAEYEYEIYMERGMEKVDDNKFVSSDRNENGLLTVTVKDDDGEFFVYENIKYLKKVEKKKYENKYGSHQTSERSNDTMNEIYDPFEDGIVLFLFFGLFFFGIMSRVAEKDKYKILGAIISCICFVALPLYVVPELTYIVTAPADFFKGIAGGLIVLLCLPFGWIIIVLIICALCSIFIK